MPPGQLGQLMNYPFVQWIHSVCITSLVSHLNSFSVIGLTVPRCFQSDSPRFPFSIFVNLFYAYGCFHCICVCVPHVCPVPRCPEEYRMWMLVIKPKL